MMSRLLTSMASIATATAAMATMPPCHATGRTAAVITEPGSAPSMRRTRGVTVT